MTARPRKHDGRERRADRNGSAGVALPVPDNATLVAVPGSFGRRAAFSNRDYDWFVYGHPRVVRVWTGQWRAASTPCADLWAPCGVLNDAARAPPPHPSDGAPPGCASLGGAKDLWTGRVCTNEPFECRLAATMADRGFHFTFYRPPKGQGQPYAAIVRMPERDPRTHDYDPDMWHTPLGLRLAANKGRRRRR